MSFKRGALILLILFIRLIKLCLSFILCLLFMMRLLISFAFIGSGQPLMQAAGVVWFLQCFVEACCLLLVLFGKAEPVHTDNFVLPGAAAAGSLR
jgi:hypothetical protein